MSPTRQSRILGGLSWSVDLEGGVTMVNEKELELIRESSTEKELKLIQLMRQLGFFKIEVHGEGGQPMRVVHIKENIRL